ncbi:hypothetical protein [Demequina capsici]|uniref:FtsX-like permease family protein n=1 Tax=Demequina capsici TaxID=3075620 RepID=A0AA96J706_9MICO|nr:hypothetical protein [Demequina sp. OYTSA14]WNM24747.1 hypothetical protein RN606_00935 [Demequina sp. OYTSA14]
MRAPAAAVAGIASAALMVITVPWDLRTYGEVFYSDSAMGFDRVGFLVIYLAIPTALLTLILTAMLGVRSQGSDERATRAALGETAATSMRRTVLAGLRDGAIATGAAFILAGAAHLFLEMTHGWPWFSTRTDAWATRAVEAAMGTVALAIAHAVAARRAGRSPVEQRRAGLEPYRPPRIGRLAIAATGALSASAGVIVGIAASHGGDYADPSATAATVSDLAYVVAWVAACGLAVTAVLPWATTLAIHALGATTRLADRAGSMELAAVLRTRATDPTKATGRVVMAIGALAFLVGLLSSVQTGVRHSDAFAFVYTEYPTASGAVTDRLLAIDGVAHVIAADIVGESPAVEIIAVDPAQLVGLDDEVALALQTHPTAAVANAPSTAQITVDPKDPFTYRPEAVVPLVGYGVAYVNSARVNLPPVGHAYFVYVSPAADRAAIESEVMTGVEGVTGQGIHYVAGQDGGYSYEDPAAGTWIFWSLLILVGLSPLAFAAVRAGGRNAATLTALGSSARTVRIAVVIEGATLAVIATLVGTATGVTARTLLTMLDRARLSLNGIITDSYVGTALGSVNWAAVTPVILLICASYAVLTAAVASAVHLETPSEALREGMATR